MLAAGLLNTPDRKFGRAFILWKHTSLRERPNGVTLGDSLGKGYQDHPTEKFKVAKPHPCTQNFISFLVTQILSRRQFCFQAGYSMPQQTNFPTTMMRDGKSGNCKKNF